MGILDHDGYVYLAKSDTGHFKIGRSVDPEKRIEHFDTQMPVEVNEWHYFRADNYCDAEKALHEICNEHGEHEKGEWWSLPEYLVWWIKDIAYYSDGEFYNGEYCESEPMEQPSESYAEYAKQFGMRTDKHTLPSRDALPSLYR